MKPRPGPKPPRTHAHAHAKAGAALRINAAGDDSTGDAAAEDEDGSQQQVAPALPEGFWRRGRRRIGQFN